MIRTRRLAGLMAAAALLVGACQDDQPDSSPSAVTTATGSDGTATDTARAPDGRNGWSSIERNGVRGFIDRVNDGSEWTFVSPSGDEGFDVDDEDIGRAEAALPRAFDAAVAEQDISSVDPLARYVRWYHGATIASEPKLFILLSSCVGDASDLLELPTPEDGGPCTAAAVFDVTSGEFDVVRFNGEN